MLGTGEHAADFQPGGIRWRGNGRGVEDEVFGVGEVSALGEAAFGCGGDSIRIGVAEAEALEIFDGFFKPVGCVGWVFGREALTSLLHADKPGSDTFLLVE